MKLLLVDEDGTLLACIDDISGYDLSQPLAQKAVMKQINKAVQRVTQMAKVQVGQEVRVNTRWGTYTVAEAPNGGRTEQGGPVHDKPFAFLVARAKLIDHSDSGKSSQPVPLIELGQEFVIKGHGVHRLEQGPNDGDEVRTIRVRDGFKV